MFGRFGLFYSVHCRMYSFFKTFKNRLKSNYKQINVFTFIIENFKYAKVGRIVL